MRSVVVAVLKVYRLVVSPFYAQTCRYYPSCAAYALGGVQTHGVVRGGWLAVRRLSRCHPWTPGGVDLVPERSAYRWWGLADGTDGEPESAIAEPDPIHSARPTCASTPPVGHGVISTSDHPALRGA